MAHNTRTQIIRAVREGSAVCRDTGKIRAVHGIYHERFADAFGLAICQADLLIKNEQQAKVYLGNSLNFRTATVETVKESSACAFTM